MARTRVTVWLGCWCLAAVFWFVALACTPNSVEFFSDPVFWGCGGAGALAWAVGVWQLDPR